MKRIVFLALLILLFFTFYFIYKDELKNHELSINERTVAANVVNDYYMAIEDKSFELVLSYIYFDQKNNNFHIDYKSRELALKEVFNNTYEKFHIIDFCTPEIIHYDESEKAYYAEVGLEVKYKNTRGGLTKEILYLKKVHGAWKIIKIKTLDRSVLFRTDKYDVQGASE